MQASCGNKSVTDIDININLIAELMCRKADITVVSACSVAVLLKVVCAAYLSNNLALGILCNYSDRVKSNCTVKSECISDLYILAADNICSLTICLTGRLAVCGNL